MLQGYFVAHMFKFSCLCYRVLQGATGLILYITNKRVIKRYIVRGVCAICIKIH